MDNERTGNLGGAGPPNGGVPPPLPPTCRNCHRIIELYFRYCPYCGQRQDAGAAWYYHPVWILLLAFCALGPFALPLVWRSQQMNATVKIVVAAVILLYSAYVLYLGWRMGTMIMRPFAEIDTMMREIHRR